MSRTYSIPITADAATVAQDLWEITPGDDKPVRILGLVIGQYTDVGDAASESAGLTILRGGTTGSGGSAPTPAPLNGVDTAAGFTVETANTTAGGGSPTTVFADVVNLQAGYQMWFPEGVQPHSNQTLGLLQVRLGAFTAGAAPADSLTFNGTLFVEEI